MIIYINQSSKKKKKQKPNAKQRARQASWQGLLDRWDIKPVDVKKSKIVLVKDTPYRRETPYYPSLNSDKGNTFKTIDKVYTGTAVLGIGTLHKSNAVPVFSKEEAEDQAKMRR
jgi:hypothetical protein